MRARRWLLAALGLVGFASAAPSARATPPPPLSEVQVIALPGVERRIDHFAVDPAGKRLFVAALDNGTLEVLDVGTGKRITSIGGLKEPQGVAYLPLVHRIVVAMRGGAVAAFDDGTYRRTATLPNLGDADNLRYDAAAGQLYLGYGEGALGVIEPSSLKLVASIPVGGHPESFRLEEAGPRVFVNVPATREVLVVDRRQRSTVMHIPLGGPLNNCGNCSVSVRLPTMGVPTLLPSSWTRPLLPGRLSNPPPISPHRLWPTSGGSRAPPGFEVSDASAPFRSKTWRAPAHRLQRPRTAPVRAGPRAGRPPRAADDRSLRRPVPRRADRDRAHP